MEDPKEKFKLWLVGFTDGDGSFVIYKTKNTYGLAFKLSQHKYNIRLLYYIKKNMGVGNVSEEKNTNMAQYCIYSREKLKKHIIPIFDKYPLLTTKQYNYEKFKKVHNILENINLSYKEKKFLIEEIIQLKPDINYIPSVWNNININKKASIELILYKEWLIGFIEAEGSFYISKNELNYTYYFSICQKKDKHLLESINIILNINNKLYFNSKDGYYYLQTKNKSSLKYIIYYINGHLKGVKSLEFKLWKRAIINNYKRKKLEKIQLIMRNLRKKFSQD